MEYGLKLLPTKPDPSWVSNFGCRNMSGIDLNFHIGDKVVYPNHGVGVIEQIGSRTIGASVERFYLLHIKASSLKVMVPCPNARQRRLAPRGAQR